MTNLFMQVVDFENLYVAYRDARASKQNGKTSKHGILGVFDKLLENDKSLLNNLKLA